MLIVHPPLTKPCEPPAALAYLSAALAAHGHSCTICDMNIEGLHFLFNTARPAEDTWSKRAYKHLQQNISALQTRATYTNADRYRRAVADSNRILEIAGKEFGLQLSLANYQDDTKSPLKSEDLRLAGQEYATNIFFPYFSRRLEELLATDNSRLHWLFPELSQPGTVYLRDDRLPESAAPGSENHCGWRPDHHLAEPTAVAQSFCWAGGPPYRRSGGRTTAETAGNGAKIEPCAARFRLR